VENMLAHSSVILVNFCDPLSEEKRFAQDLTISSGEFHVAHEYVFEQNLTIRYNNSFINLYIVPGDSVYLTIDGSKLSQNPGDAVVFSGDRAQINEQLFRWTNYAYKLPIPEFNPSAAPDECLQSIKQCFSAIQDTIDAYAQRHVMSDFVKRWAFTDYKFLVANQLLDYEDKANKWKVLTDSIFDVYQEQNFQSMYFEYHIHACIRALITENEEITKQFEQKNYEVVFRAVIKKLLEEAPKGTVRDMMLYCLLMGGAPELYDSMPELQSFFSQPVIKEKIASFMQEQIAKTRTPVPVTGKTMQGVSYLDNDSIIALPNIELIPYLLERHKNKVLYIDVWATWCGPCLEAMKDAPVLHEYFAGKEVVFVNLCLESTSERWVQTLNKHAIKGENYYLDGNASKIFMGTHNIGGFPTYMLIGRDRQFRSNVARPTNTLSAIEQINACLQEAY
jgi:thiol-disulfide isomerase/thioredoxin